jgi:hypothetical protein
MNLNRFAMLALLSLATPALAAPRPLNPDERMALRCGAVFAIVANRQARHDPAMAQYPDMAKQGREYFVRLSAQLMDDAGLDAAGITAAAQAEARAVERQRGVDGMMPFCLKVMEAQPGFNRAP